MSNFAESESSNHRSGIGVGIGDTTTGDSQAESSDLELLKVMEAMNRANEEDTRSIVSIHEMTAGASTSGTPSRIGSYESGACLSKNSSQERDSQVDEDLLRTWGDLVKNWVDEYNNRPQYIREMVRRGIPCQFRPIAWQLLTNADVESVRELYGSTLVTSSRCESRIWHAVSRCQQKHRDITENSIVNVIKAYTLHDRDIPYPGETFVYTVVTLLAQMSELQSFAVLVQLRESFRHQSLYQPSVANLALRIYQLECLTQEFLPHLYSHLTKINFDTSTYASSWFLDLYSSQLRTSHQLSNRIMDVFMCEGIDVVFRLALSALRVCESDLLRLNAEGAKSYFQCGMAERLDGDHDLLIEIASEIELDTGKMRKLEQDFVESKSRHIVEDHDDADSLELHKLRIFNSLLQQRLHRLEEDSSFLADELVSVEPPMVESATNEETKSELLQLRRRNADIRGRLEEAFETIKELTGQQEESAGVEDKEIQVDDTPTIEHIHMLQQEVMEARTRDTDYVAVTKDLKIRAQELDLANEKLKAAPSDACLSNLKNEFTELQMRESEANRLLQETKQKFKEFHEDWEQYVAKQPHNTEGPTTNEELHREFMGALIREADAFAELKETQQKVMELETQGHVFENNLRRQDEEYKRLQWKNDACPRAERELRCSIRETRHKLNDVEARQKEQSILARLREAELLEVSADLKNQLSEMESKYYEKWTHGELCKDNIDDEYEDDTDEVETLEDIDSSYHSSGTITEDDIEQSQESQEMKTRKYDRPGATVLNSTHSYGS